MHTEPQRKRRQMPIIEVERLAKTFRTRDRAAGLTGSLRSFVAPQYREREAVKQISFSLEAGEILAFIGLENLTDIRERTRRKHGKKASKKQRKANARQSSWSFAELHASIAYKALLHESMAIKVDAHYTSQACPLCGHTCKANRPNQGLLFVCQNCHYTLHADLVGKEVRGTSIQEHNHANASYPARLDRNGAIVSRP